VLAGTLMSLIWFLFHLRTMEVVVTTGAITCAKLQSNHHHQQTNTQFVNRPDALTVEQTNSVRSLNGKFPKLQLLILMWQKVSEL